MNRATQADEAARDLRERFVTREEFDCVKAANEKLMTENTQLKVDIAQLNTEHAQLKKQVEYLLSVIATHGDCQRPAYTTTRGHYRGTGNPQLREGVLWITCISR